MVNHPSYPLRARNVGVADANNVTVYIHSSDQYITIIPVEFSLSQNYPNPFNPTTTIKFGIPKETKVILKVYDVLGKEISTIVNQKLEPGYYKYEWDASRFASGVYFYRIEAGSFVNIKKMMILK